MTEALAGETVLVTGGGSGIGRMTALKAAAQGAALAVLDRDGGAAEATAKMIVAAGGKARAWAVDVAEPAPVAAAVAQAAAALGPVGGLVNVAGIDLVSDVEKIADADWRRMFAVTVDGAFHTVRAAMPGMLARRKGSIVNMSSLHAVRGQAQRAHYAAAKAAIMGFTRSVAREKGPFGIRCNAVAPGPIDTPLWRGSMAQGDAEAAMAQRSRIIPLGRLGKPEEVANAIVFLLGPEASYITGTVLSIDGGEVMH